MKRLSGVHCGRGVPRHRKAGQPVGQPERGNLKRRELVTGLGRGGRFPLKAASLTLLA